MFYSYIPNFTNVLVIYHLPIFNFIKFFNFFILNLTNLYLDFCSVSVVLYKITLLMYCDTN